MPPGSFSNARFAAALRPARSTMSRDGAPRAKEMVSAAMGRQGRRPNADPPVDGARGPAMDAFLIPGGFGARQELYNRRLHEFITSLPEETLLTSVCTGSWIYGHMGLLDGLPATNRKEPDKVESAANGKVPIDRLADIAPACRISRARVVDAGRIVTAGGITSGMEMGFHLLRRAGYD